jgi:hypothetical protein
LCLFLINHETPAWMIATAVMFFGLPTGLTSTATQAAVYIQAPATEIGNGLHSLALVMGALSVVLLVGTIFDRTLPRGPVCWSLVHRVAFTEHFAWYRIRGVRILLSSTYGQSFGVVTNFWNIGTSRRF